MKRPENKFGDETRKNIFFDIPPKTNFYTPPYKKIKKVLESHETSRKQVWRQNSKTNFFGTPPK